MQGDERMKYDPTLASHLPRTSRTRWSYNRKGAVVQEIVAWKMTREEALTKYELSEEELNSWFELFGRFGVNGLRSTRIQRYKEELSNNTQS